MLVTGFAVLYKKSSIDAVLAAFLLQHICHAQTDSNLFIACDESFDFSTMRDRNLYLINLDLKPDAIRPIQKKNYHVGIFSNHPKLSNWFGYHDDEWYDHLGENRVGFVSYLSARVKPHQSVSRIVFDYVAEIIKFNSEHQLVDQARNPTLNYRVKWLIDQVQQHLFSPTSQTRLIAEMLNHGEITFAELETLIFQLSENELRDRMLMAAGALRVRDPV